MWVTSGKASRAHHIVCPFCESGELASVGPGFARCGSCGLPLLGSALGTLQDVIGLPDARGSHPCQCGHPEMRRLPDGIYHCPACGSEVLPIEITLGPKRTHLGSASAWDEEALPHPGGARTSLSVHGEGG
jgi:ribosomal protein L37AE/L43A